MGFSLAIPQGYPSLLGHLWTFHLLHQPIYSFYLFCPISLGNRRF
jgi:hypothetical protein